MYNFIKLVVAAFVAIIVFVICNYIEDKITKGNKYLNYLEKVKKDNIVKLIIYIFLISVSYRLIRMNFSFKIINYVFLAFSAKGTYFFLMNILSILWRKRTRLKRYQSNQEKDFAYMDNIIKLNLIGFILLAIGYTILLELGVFYPYTGEIGSMLMLMTIMTFYKDVFNVYAEFEKRNPTSLFSKISEKEWNLIDTVYLKFHSIKSFLRMVVRNKTILILFSVYLLAYIIVVCMNFRVR